MTESRYDPYGKLDRILRKSGIPKESFESFLNLPYALGLDAAHEALVNPNANFAFLKSSDCSLTKMPKALLNRPVNEDDRLRQIYIDRIFQFYLMKSFYRFPEGEIGRHLSLVGLEKIDRHLAAGRGVILINSHYGPGQVAQIILSRLGYAITSIGSRDFYGPLGIINHSIDVIPLVETFHARVIAQGCEMLRSGKILHTTGDGYTGLSGKEYGFFGRERAFTNSFGYMMDRENSVSLPIFISIAADGHVTMTVKSAIKPNVDLLDRNERIQAMTTRYVNFLRAAWRDDPVNIPSGTIHKFLQLPKTRNSVISSVS